MNFSANETDQVLLKQTLCHREIPDEGYWGWSSIIIYCLAVLTVLANFMLIYVIRNSPTLRKQVLQKIKNKRGLSYIFCFVSEVQSDYYIPGLHRLAMWHVFSLQHAPELQMALGSGVLPSVPLHLCMVDDCLSVQLHLCKPGQVHLVPHKVFS